MNNATKIYVKLDENRETIVDWAAILNTLILMFIGILGSYITKK